MERVGVRQLRQHASRYLELVKAGETVEVTERGELVALLVPAHPARSARDRMVSAGRLIPRRTQFALPLRRKLPDDAGTASEVLDELRSERLR